MLSAAGVLEQPARQGRQLTESKVAARRCRWEATHDAQLLTVLQRLRRGARDGMYLCRDPLIQRATVTAEEHEQGQRIVPQAGSNSSSGGA